MIEIRDLCFVRICSVFSRDKPLQQTVSCSKLDMQCQEPMMGIERDLDGGSSFDDVDEECLIKNMF